MKHSVALIGFLIILLGATPALSHHSFAAFFDPDRSISVTGVVTAFQFTNPHGLISIDVKGRSGQVEYWRAETNAPVILARRGWARDTLKAGDVVTLSGWPARDGKPYLRLRQANRGDGSVIGIPFEMSDK